MYFVFSDSSSSVCIECIIGSGKTTVIKTIEIDTAFLLISVAGVLVFVAIVALIVVIVFFSFKYYTTKSKKVLNIVAIGQVHVDVSRSSPF